MNSGSVGTVTINVIASLNDVVVCYLHLFTTFGALFITCLFVLAAQKILLSSCKHCLELNSSFARYSIVC